MSEATAADRAKIMERVQKCLNLAQNAGATPGEAAAALNAAQRMMEKFGITEDDLGLVGMGQATVRISIQAGSGRKLPLAISLMCGLMHRAFGVKGMVHTEVRVSDSSWCVTYFGPIHRVEMAVYTHAVLNRAIEKGWAKHLREHPELKGLRGAKTGYVAGWVQGVSNLIHAFATNDKEQASIKLFMEQTHGSLGKAKTSNMAVDRNSLNAGKADARGFSINRPMNGQETVKIGM